MSDQDISLYLTVGSQCSYLPHRESRSLLVEPALVLDGDIYAKLLAHGFRRNGNYIYRPHCEGCSACIATRIPVRKFTARRSQRRCWQMNSDLRIERGKTLFTQEHYELYKSYLLARHEEGEMVKSTMSDARAFLLSPWCDTELMEIRQGEKLVAVAVTDRVPGALSAVYTFFEPQLSQRALGVYAILQQVQTAVELEKTWLYLGYYIAECRKMAYKTDYRPIELLQNGRWQRLNNEQ